MLTYNNSDKGNMIRESCFIHLFTHIYIFILRILQNIEDVHILVILIYLGNMNNHK